MSYGFFFVAHMFWRSHLTNLCHLFLGISPRKKSCVSSWKHERPSCFDCLKTGVSDNPWYLFRILRAGKGLTVNKTLANLGGFSPLIPEFQPLYGLAALKCTVPVRPSSKRTWKKWSFSPQRDKIHLENHWFSGTMFHTNSLKENPFGPGLRQADENASSAQDLMVFCHAGEGSEMPRPTTWDV